MIIVERETSETRVRVRLDRESRITSIATAIPFCDHMLVTLARYADVGLAIEARGDLRHHVIEDVAIVLGLALAKAATGPIARYGDRFVPMDDALVHCALDFGGRPYYEGQLPSTLYDHFMRTVADHARLTLHLRVLRGRDRHHIIEAAFKALGLALRQALAIEDALFSTKGEPLVREES